MLHCENIDAVTYDLITEYNIVDGTYVNVAECEKYGYRVLSQCTYESYKAGEMLE